MFSFQDTIVDALPEVDCYKILDLPDDATKSDVRKKFLQMIREVHPDSGSHPDIQKYQKIMKAYKILSNLAEEKKDHYEILGISQRASATDIKNAFHKLSLISFFRILNPCLATPSLAMPRLASPCLAMPCLASPSHA